MKKAKLFFGLMIVLGCSSPPNENSETMQNTAKTEDSKQAWAIALHGGAGIIRKEDMSPEMEQAYRASLDTALSIGERMLIEGKSALDVVEAVVVYLEDNPLFNAGKGAVFTHQGKNELDASIMDGKTMKAGAVGAITNIKNPIKVARAVMVRTEHVMLVGRGAEIFAHEIGMDTVGSEYFFNQLRWDALQNALEKERQTGQFQLPKEEYKFGTVGCVALDKDGHLAAATSTGGMTNKRWNRLGDSPIIGAGTYADNKTCAVSGTGHGEYFIRYTVARDIAARMEYLGASLREAADDVVLEKLVQIGGSGGVISVDRNGHIAMPHNTPGMYRASAVPGNRSVKIYQNE